MAKDITVGIDIGSSSIRVVVTKRDRGDAVPSIIGTGVAPSAGIRHGYIINHEEAVASISRALDIAARKSQTKIRSAYIAIGGISLESSIETGSTIISRADGEITALDIEKAIEGSKNNIEGGANKHILHHVPIKFKLDGKDVLGKAIGLKGVKLEVKTFFVTCLKQHYKDIIAAVEDAGVEVTDIVATPLAASIVTLSKRQKTAGCVLVNIGGETVSMVVFENDLPVLLHVFPIGGTDITNDIALGLKVSIDDAEQIKLGRDMASYSRKKLDDIIEARLTDIFEIVDNDLKKIGRSGLLPAGIIITGGGSLLPNIEEMAKTSLRIPSKITSADILQNSKGKIADGSWAVSYGLTLIPDIEQGQGMHKESRLVESISSNIMGWLRQFLP